MAYYEHLPIYKKSMDVAIYIENIVRGFPKYHKYTMGTDLRNKSREIVSLIIKANSEKQKLPALFMLRDNIEELKVIIRIGKEVKAFNSLKSFTHLIEDVISISRQNEGWIKSIKGKS